MDIDVNTKIQLDSITEDGAVSVLIQKYFMLNGEKKVLENHCEALTPNRLERAKEILPAHLYEVVTTLWTPEVVAAWEEKVAEAKSEVL